jgi:autotransporter passenger strand-loop-strand repeat protein
VFSSGVATGTTILNQAQQTVQAGGTAIGTLVSTGGLEDVTRFGITSGTTISSGGSEFVQAGGTAIDTVISSGGTGSVVRQTAR